MIKEFAPFETLQKEATAAGKRLEDAFEPSEHQIIRSRDFRRGTAGHTEVISESWDGKQYIADSIRITDNKPIDARGNVLEQAVETFSIKETLGDKSIEQLEKDFKAQIDGGKKLQDLAFERSEMQKISNNGPFRRGVAHQSVIASE